MIVDATGQDVRAILQYIGNQYEECLYLYINLKKYGINNANILVWVDKEDEILRGIYLQYFDCLHFYSKESAYPIERLGQFLEEVKPQTIFMPERYARNLQQALLEAHYAMERMDVISIDKLLPEGNVDVYRATREEVPKIARFLMSDESYSKIYDEKTLCQQLLQRYDDGFSRYHYVLQDGEIAVCEATNAELDDMAILGSLLTAVPYRGRGLGSSVVRNIWNEVYLEGKLGFAFISNPDSKRIHDRMGFETIGAVAKFYKRADISE